jgi:alkanesulfonate monooxygenase SsuD/methylene tetrahydromethanopterin reductase-like flavin-dependent oxidoreductase (luciferase family)
MSDIPFGVLDLVPIPSGSTATDALRDSLDLAQPTERFGYAPYWFAEHHLTPASRARPPRSSSR